MPEAATPQLPCLNIIEGRCSVFFAFDIGSAVNLERARELVSEPPEGIRLLHKQKTPKYFDYNPRPLRISQNAAAFCFTDDEFCTRENVDVTLFDFGGVSVCYRIDLRGSIDRLVNLGELLYENADLLEDARKRVEQVISVVHPAVTKPRLASLSENYLVFHLAKTEGPSSINDILSKNRDIIAQTLRVERDALSEQQIEDALGFRVSYSPRDLVLIDWSTAFIFGEESADVLAVIEFANLELLEMRLQDEELDRTLEHAYQGLSGKKRLGMNLNRVAQLQVDSAMLFESVNNALKLLGDQYLARVYQLLARRFHLEEWDASILRKLDMLNSIYTKMVDRSQHHRSLFLEAAIVLLIVFEIVLSLATKH